jgi:hypothetical protein
MISLRLEPMCLSAGVLDRADATQRREGRLTNQSFGVVARGDQELGGADRTDAGLGEQPWNGLAGQAFDGTVAVAGFLVEVLPPSGECSQAQAGPVGRGQVRAGGDEVGGTTSVHAASGRVVEFQDEAA